MSFRTIQLEDLEVDIKKEDNNIYFTFVGAYIKKTMDDAEEKTLWIQDGDIILRDLDKGDNLKAGNNKIISISISYDFYTYKNMLSLPFNKKGLIDISINFKSIKNIINIKCSEIEVVLKNNPKYVRHIKKTE